MPNSSIAIVTPTLNQGAYIEKTILSVLEQQNVSVEYIVVDGGSTDDTADILKRFQTDIQWVVKLGMGQSAAINWGWRQTKAPVLAWLNSDDVLLPRALERVVRLFSGSSESDIVYGKCDFIDQHGDYIAAYPTRDFNYPEYVSGAENFIPQPSTFLKRQVFESLGGVDEGLNFLLDFDYWIRAGLVFKIDHFPETLSQLRLHSEAKSIKRLNGFANELVSIYSRFFTRPDLPQSILDLRKKGLRNANLIAANISSWGQDFSAARTFALASYRINPLKPSPFLPFYLMGKPGLNVIMHLQKNPYIKYT
ncbi:MAG: glycosyltransferase family 2 protein [Anaerolineales bacterium]